MTDTTTTETDGPQHLDVLASQSKSRNPFTLANAKKAWAAGVAGAAAAAGTLTLTGALDKDAILADVGIVLGGFVVAFAAAWVPSNAS